MVKVKKPVYFWSQTDNNIRIIDHNNRIAYSMSDLGLGHFDNINRMIKISDANVSPKFSPFWLSYLMKMAKNIVKA